MYQETRRNVIMRNPDNSESFRNLRRGAAILYVSAHRIRAGVIYLYHEDPLTNCHKPVSSVTTVNRRASRWLSTIESKYNDKISSGIKLRAVDVCKSYAYAPIRNRI